MSALSQPRRVLMTTDAVGGVWTYSLELAAGLAARGVETSLVVLGPQPSVPQVAQAAEVPGLSLITPGLELEWRDRRKLGFSEVRLLRTLEQAIQPDLVHVNGFREAACGWKAPVLLVAHSCVRSWWRACRGEEPPKQDWDAYLAGVQAGLRAADAVVAPTAAFLAELERLYGPLPRGRTIPNGRRPVIPAARRRPYILAAGRLWDEAKNVASLAAIADELPWPVMVAGEAGDKERQAGLIHLGLLPESEVLQRMAEAEIFAAPSRYEPFGLAVLEAASAGAALVLSDLPSFRELWDGAACFVPADDPQALSATLQRLIADVPARHAMQAAARARARRYGPVAMVDGYINVYAELLEGRAQPREVAA
jgi:glycosyltransferase involved in cell wall biosynthesis